MRFKAIFIFSLILLGFHLVKANNLDSLKRIWQNKSLPDTLRLQALQTLNRDVFLPNQQDSAIHYAGIQSDFAQIKNLPFYVIKAQETIGQAYLKKAMYDSALSYALLRYKTALEVNQQKEIAWALNQLAVLYKTKKDYKKAITACAKGLEMAQRMKSFELIQTLSQTLYQLYRITNNYKKALEMHELHVHIKDSLTKTETQKKMFSQNIKHQREKQALSDSLSLVQQNALNTLILVKKANKRYVILGLIVLALTLIGNYLRVRMVKNENEKRALFQEVKLLKVQSFLKLSSARDAHEQLNLDKNKIEESIGHTLNDTDWNVLSALYKNPSIGNQEIANKVSLSVAGVRSSLKRMYSYFNIDQTSNQRIILVMEATKRSNHV